MYIESTNQSFRLALRSLSSLKLPNMLEYLEPAVQKGLHDNNGYVRKTAIIGCVKIFHINPPMIRENNTIIDRLYALVADSDVHVSTNAIYVLEEVLEDIGGILFNWFLQRCFFFVY